MLASHSELERRLACSTEEGGKLVEASAVQSRQLEEQIASLQAERDSLISDHSTMITCRNDLEAQLAESITQQNALASTNEGLKMQLSTLQAERDDIAASGEGLGAQLAALQIDRDAIIAGKETIEQRAHTLEVQLAHLQKEHDQLVSDSLANYSDSYKMQVNELAAERSYSYREP